MNPLHNPEFARQLRQRMTLSRLLVAVGLVGLVLGVAFQNAAATDPQLLLTLAVSMLFLLGLWGASGARGAFADDVEDGVWDQQRLSGIGAWPLAWGKLLGGAAVAWCGAALALVGLALGLVRSHTVGLADGVRLTVAVITGLVGLQAFHLALTLFAWRGRRGSGAQAGLVTRAATGWVGLVVVGFAVLPSLFNRVLGRPDFGNMGTGSWYGLPAPVTVWFLLNVLAAAGWSVVAVWRLLRAELLYRDPPILWLAFCVFLVVYPFGFVYGRPGTVFPALGVNWSLDEPLVVHGLGAGVLLAVVAVFSLVAEPLSRPGLRAWWTPSGWFARAPLFVVAGGLALALLLLAALLGGGRSPAGALGLGLAIAGFMTRDLLLLVALRLAGIGQRGLGSLVFVLLLLYVLLPLLLTVFHVTVAAGLFSPLAAVEDPRMAALPWIEAALAAAYLGWSWRHPEPAWSARGRQG